MTGRKEWTIPIPSPEKKEDPGAFIPSAGRVLAQIKILVFSCRCSIIRENILTFDTVLLFQKRNFALI